MDYLSSRPGDIIRYVTLILLDEMATENTRYKGKPLLRLAELWVQWVIDEIDEEDLCRLTAMEPQLRTTWELEGSWHEMIESVLHIQPEIRDNLRTMWRNNLDIAKRDGLTPPIEMFAQSIANQLTGT